MRRHSPPSIAVIWPGIAFQGTESCSTNAVSSMPASSTAVTVSARPWFHSWLSVWVNGAWLLWNFSTKTVDFQFVQNRPWIPALGVRYIVGVDGISIFMIAVTALLFPLGLLASEKYIQHRVKAYIADSQWDDAVESLRRVMESDGAKMISITPTRFVNARASAKFLNSNVRSR